MKSGHMSRITLFLFLKIALTLLGLLNFHMKLRNSLVYICLKKKKKGSWDFEWDCTEPEDQFWKYCHLNISLPIHEHSTSFHSFKTSITFFNDVLHFSVYNYCINFIKFSPKYFILFDSFVHGITFLISFLDCSLLVYKNTIDFRILILYPETLLNLFISSNNC